MGNAFLSHFQLGYPGPKAFKHFTDFTKKARLKKLNIIKCNYYGKVKIRQ